MPQPTTAPAQIVADRMIRTVELGVRITDAAVAAGETTVLWCDLLTDGPGRYPGCGVVGVYRDLVERRVSDVPVGGIRWCRVSGFRATGMSTTAATARCSPTTAAGWLARVGPPGLVDHAALRGVRAAAPGDR
jgi:hypothetical protein